MSEQPQHWLRKPEMLVGLSAVLVSVVALGVGIYSAYIDRLAARASVWPSLMIAQSFNADRFQYVVLNQGTGPAIVQHARVLHQGNPVATWKDWITELGYEDVGFSQSHIGGGVVRPAQKVVAFETTDADLRQHLVAGVDVTVELCYCSVYEQCWSIDSIDVATEVESCTINTEDRFRQ